ncbi:MAG: hypothetical protein CMJ82_13290 [Planctomycetaceae bacterium]|nr:hypothetical protein [Planctomycetaceae bacterium]
MKLRRKTKSGLSMNDRRWIKKKIEAKLSVETLERRELLAADIVGGLADVAEGEGDPKVQMRLVATDLQGQPVDTVFLNQAFNLQGYVKDLRSEAKGVFTSYMDVEFDKSLTQVVGAISHADDYKNFNSGTIDVSGDIGLIDEVGGMAGLSELGSGEKLVFTVPMRATAAGTIVFDGNHADIKPAHQVLVYGENEEVTEELLTIVDYSLEVSDLGALPYNEDFNDSSADAMTVKQGSFAIENSRYNSTPSNFNERALTVIDLTVDIPSKTRFQSTVNLEYVNGFRRNAYQVFAYQDNSNYKIAGLNADARVWVIGEFQNGQYRELRRGNTSPAQNRNYNLELQIDGKRATLHVDGQAVAGHTFGSDLNVGKFGLLAIGAQSRFDDVHISEILPAPIAEGDFDETVVGQAITIDVLANDSHEQVGTALHIVSADGFENGTIELRDNNQDNKADVLVFTPANGFSGSESFTYVVGDANGQTDSASVLVDVLPGIPLEEDFSTENPAGFEVVTGNWQVVGEQYVAQNRNGYSLAKIRTGMENPAETEFSATVAMPRVSGYLSNAELIFDFEDSLNYKFVGGNVDSRIWYLGHVANGQRTITKTQSATIGRGEYQLAVVIRGKELAFLVDGQELLTHSYAEAANGGLFGLGASRARPVVDNVKIREFVPAPVAEDDSVQTVVGTPVDIAVLGNDGHETDGTFIYLDSVSAVENGQAVPKDTNDDGKNDTVTFIPTDGFRGAASFEYLVKDNNGQQDRGRVTVQVAASLPLEVDFNDGSAVDFNYEQNQWRLSGGKFSSVNDRGFNLATVNLGVALPGKYKLGAVQSTQGYLASGFLFDYSNTSNYKFARQTTQGYQIGQVVNGRTTILKNVRETVRTDRSYALELHVENNLVTFYSDDVSKASVEIAGTLNDGKVGLYTYRSRTQFDDFFVKEIVPTPIAGDDVSQTVVNTPVTLNVLGNDYHEREGDTFHITSVIGEDNGTVELVDSNDDGKHDQLTFTPATDYRGIETFSYVIEDDAGYQDQGRVEITVASELPINIPFDNNEAPDLVLQEDQWVIADEKLTAVGRNANRGTILIGEALPVNYQASSQINIQQVGGYSGNAYLMVNYQDDQNYIYAGADQRNRRWIIAQVTEGQTTVLAQNRQEIATRTNYDMTVRVEGKQVSLIVDENQRATYTFDENLNSGQVGVLTINGRSYFDNIVVEEYVVKSDAEDDRTGTGINETITIDVLANDYAPNGKLNITAVSTAENATLTLVDLDDDGMDDKIRFEPATDFEGVVTFTYDIEDPKNFTDTAAVTVRVADSLNYTEDFDDNQAQDFESISGVWEVANQRFRNDGSGYNISLVDLGEETPAAFETGVILNSQNISGKAQNGMIVFNYVDPNNYRYAGALTGGRSWVIGESVNGNLRHLRRVSDSDIAAERDLAISLLYENHTATLKFGNEQVAQWQFENSVAGADIGLLAINAVTEFDDFYARAVDDAMGDE